ncbi:hypothetical protein CLU80_2123 [Pseudomonas sp. 29]|jgi:hypothetical protein|uniref:plasmid-related protein n=1 Tax=Pseudomonas sp. 29 TaxID=2035197 RepID=UPI000C193459|nr:plasmid-related protein [Pseudomonas sp. 29]PIF49780.1 hypothetical protein CLU80_2123 [Pseudomonas sp. 29]
MHLHENAIEDSLVSLYGPLLSLAQLANVLHRSPDGLRIALSGTQPYAERINLARVKVGRRVYFRTASIAAYLVSAGV